MSTSAAEPARPTLFAVAAAERPAFTALALELADLLDVVTVDLPQVAEEHDAVASVVAAIKAHGSPRWLIAGEGRGGRIAELVAERTLAGRSGLFGLAGVVLLEHSGDDASAVPTLRLDPPRLDPTRLDPLPVDGLAAAIRSFWAQMAGTGPAVPADVARVIASARTSTRVRALLAERLLADDPHYAPRALTVPQLATLRAIADRVVPQDDVLGGTGRIDLAARVDAQLADGEGDGWRNADLPADPIAYGLALDALAGFERASAAEQEARLDTLGDEPRGALSADQLSAWFEDCRVDLVRQWLAHPASMARIGYDGYASGGDTLPLAGFRALGADQRDDWEPTARSLR